MPIGIHYRLFRLPDLSNLKKKWTKLLNRSDKVATQSEPQISQSHVILTVSSGGDSWQPIVRNRAAKESQLAVLLHNLEVEVLLVVRFAHAGHQLVLGELASHVLDHDLFLGQLVIQIERILVVELLKSGAACERSLSRLDGVTRVLGEGLWL